MLILQKNDLRISLIHLKNKTHVEATNPSLLDSLSSVTIVLNHWHLWRLQPMWAVVAWWWSRCSALISRVVVFVKISRYLRYLSLNPPVLRPGLIFFRVSLVSLFGIVWYFKWYCHRIKIKMNNSTLPGLQSQCMAVRMSKKARSWVDPVDPFPFHPFDSSFLFSPAHWPLTQLLIDRHASV